MVRKQIEQHWEEKDFCIKEYDVNTKIKTLTKPFLFTYEHSYS